MILSDFTKNYPIWVSSVSSIYRARYSLLIERLDLADIRRENIVKASSPIPGMPPRRAPFHGREHQWRLVDLELCAKVNMTPRASKQLWATKCVGVLLDIEAGDCVEDSDDE